jgi:hypothetical protein
MTPIEPTFESTWEDSQDGMAVMRAISLKYDPDQVFRKLVKEVGGTMWLETDSSTRINSNYKDEL